MNTLFDINLGVKPLWVSYCMACTCVWEDNPRALASVLSPVHTHNHAIDCLFHQHACALCAF